MAGTSISTPFSGDQLRKQRERAGLTQDALISVLADAGHVLDRSVVSNWETGRSKPRPLSLSVLVGVLASRLEISVDEALQRLAPEAAA